MGNEEAWIAPYYAGDCMLMMQDNPDLAFYLPEEESFNTFIDAMCIPSCAENKAEAELFINFICEPEISGGNMDYIGYGTPGERGQRVHGPRDGRQRDSLSGRGDPGAGRGLRGAERRGPES